jgi:hypothetical protein
MEKMRIEKGDGEDINFPSCVFGRYDKKNERIENVYEIILVKKSDGRK